MTRTLTAALLIVAVVGSADAAIIGTYVDATSGIGGNTVRNSDGSVDGWVGGANDYDNLWWARSLGEGEQGGSFWTTAGPGYEDGPMLKTTLTGLTAGASYEIGLLYQAIGNWVVQAGFSSGSLTTYGATDGFLAVPTREREVSLGTTTANGSGEIAVFIDDVTGGAPDMRARYDGLSYRPPPPTISGVTIEDVSSEYADYDRAAIHVVNGDGFDPMSGYHTTTVNGNMWLSNGTYLTPNDPLPAFITFDLEGNYDLDNLTVWNFNESLLDFTTRGAKDVEISVASEGGLFTSLGNFIFNEAPGSSTTDFGQLIDLSGYAAANNVRWVRFDITSNHGSVNDLAGLSEVVFTGTAIPEPSTLTLLGLGALALFVWRPKRK